MRLCGAFPAVEGLEEVVRNGVSDGEGEGDGDGDDVPFDGCVGCADDDCVTVIDPDVGADLDQTPQDATTV